MPGLMTGKRGLVMGVANERSIAWGIAKALADEGAELAFTYQGEGFGKRVEPLAASVFFLSSRGEVLCNQPVRNFLGASSCFGGVPLPLMLLLSFQNLESSLGGL